MFHQLCCFIFQYKNQDPQFLYSLWPRTNIENQLKKFFKVANLLYHLSWLNQINSCDVEFGSLQHFACKVSELYPIPTRYYVRAVGRNYILFLFSFWSGRFMDNIQLSHQLLNSFCNSLKLNLGKVRSSILKLFYFFVAWLTIHWRI